MWLFQYFQIYYVYLFFVLEAVQSYKTLKADKTYFKFKVPRIPYLFCENIW